MLDEAMDLIAYEVHYATGKIDELAFVGNSRAVTDPKLHTHIARKYQSANLDYSIQSWTPIPKVPKGIRIMNAPINATVIPDEHWTLQPEDVLNPEGCGVGPKQTNDPINHPAHYNQSAIEVIDAIEAWGLNFSLGSAVKYIARAKHKGRELEDLKKARWYVNREIERLEKQYKQEKTNNA